MKELQNNILYKNCIPQWLPVINQSRQDHSFRKAASIFKEGDAVRGVFFIRTGKVKILQNWGNGKELILRFANSGDMLGYRGLGKKKIYPVTATCLENTEVFYLNMDVFEATLQVNPRLTYSLMDFYANELEETEKRMRQMAHLEAKGRMMEALLLLENKFGLNGRGYINIRLTKQDIASYIGTTYETVSRMTGELQNERLIETNGKEFRLLPQKRKSS